MKELSRSQQKEFAKKLYLTEDAITNKEIAARVGSTPQTIGKWIREERWEDLKVSLLTSKESQLAWLYNQISALRQAVDSREDETKRYISSREADTIVKLTNAIKKLETGNGDRAES